ncbi:MAG: hypothetical protein WAZ44_03395 [Minisyncoccia bacterium]
MKHDIKQPHSDVFSSDVRANSPTLFGSASQDSLLAKLVRGGDFLKLTIVR